MKLDVNQQKKLLGRLSEVWQQPKSCAVCGHNEWDVSDIIFELREFNSGNLIIGGQSSISPVVQVNCRNCGHTLFFNAIKFGLLEKNDESASTTK